MKHMRIFRIAQGEYMQAVEDGDLQTAARLVHQKALESGYGIGPLFHGGRYKPGVGENFIVGEEGFIFFAPEQTAQWYAEQDERSGVTPVYLREDEYLEISEMEWLHDTLEGGTPLMEAAEPYSGVKISITKNADDPAWGPGPVYGVMSSDGIKLAYPVTRDDQGGVIPLEQRFDPSKTDPRY